MGGALMGSLSRPRVALIAGPTASGKSALAVRLAERLGGRVINADSMQVYRDLRILTARPMESEMAVAPHALYTNSDETLKAVRALANKYNAPVLIHLSETKKENDDNLAKRKQTPT